MRDMYNLRQIPSEAKIRKSLRRLLFGKNVFCPWCRSRKVISERVRYRCVSCRQRFSLLSHTWLTNLKLPLVEFWAVLWCWTAQVPIRQTRSLTKLPDQTVRHWFDQFRSRLPDQTHVLERLIQLDEAFFHRRFLMLGKQVGTRKLAYAVSAGTSPQREHAASFLFEFVEPGSQLWTDGAGIYRNINRIWPIQHSRDIHRRFEFRHTSEVEGIFGNYRTFVRRMYHHHWSVNLEKYVREFCFRFSSPELFENPLYYLSKALTLVTTC